MKWERKKRCVYVCVRMYACLVWEWMSEQGNERMRESVSEGVPAWKRERMREVWKVKKKTNRAPFSSDNFVRSFVCVGAPRLTLLPNFCDWLYTLRERYDYICKSKKNTDRTVGNDQSGKIQRETSIPRDSTTATRESILLNVIYARARNFANCYVNVNSDRSTEIVASKSVEIRSKPTVQSGSIRGTIGPIVPRDSNYPT